MNREYAENWLVVILSMLMAIAGVAALRVLLGLNHHSWGVAYVATGMTASIRWTSKGVGWTSWSVLRGVICLMGGLYACQLMGYTMGPVRPVRWVPEEVMVEIGRVR
jgi:hypothetical protein